MFVLATYNVQTAKLSPLGCLLTASGLGHHNEQTKAIFMSCVLLTSIFLSTSAMGITKRTIASTLEVQHPN